MSTKFKIFKGVAISIAIVVGVPGTTLVADLIFRDRLENVVRIDLFDGPARGSTLYVDFRGILNKPARTDIPETVCLEKGDVYAVDYGDNRFYRSRVVKAVVGQNHAASKSV